MVKKIQPEAKKIGEYLKLNKNGTFVIPQYQRAYSWGVEQCDKLWQDIIDYIENGNEDPYFFGTIIINCKENDEQLELIDGQQRTTTFLLLLKALLICINNAIKDTNNDPDSAPLYRGLKARRTELINILYKTDVEYITEEPTEKDTEIYKSLNLLTTLSVNEKYKEELNNILKAKNYEDAQERVVKIPYKQKDNKYTNFFRNFNHFYKKAIDLRITDLNNVTKKIIQQCEVIEIKSWQVEQAISMFNSLNSSGLPLYDSDIISAMLYEQAAKKEKTETFEQKWNELILLLEKVKIASLDSILMQQMYYTRAKKQEYVSSTGAIDVTTPGLRRYFIKDNKSLIENPIKLCDEMFNLTEIWNKISFYPIVQILFKFNENSKLFLASYLNRFKNNEITEDKINTILECLLRLFVILEIVETGYSSSKFKSFLFKENLKLVNEEIKEDEIIADFNKHIQKEWQREEIKEQIFECNKNSLVYVNEYLFAKEISKKDNKQIDFKFGDSYDIEHIMPNSGRNLHAIRVDAGITNEEEFEDIVNKLGNKILLESNINRSVGNEWFRIKIATDVDNDKTGYINSNYPIAQKLVEQFKDEPCPKWLKEDIIKYTKKASERITKFIFNEE